MQNALLFFVVILTFLLPTGCNLQGETAEQPSSPPVLAQSDTTVYAEPAPAMPVPPSEETTDQEPGEEKIRTTGIIERIEDGGYPMFVITVHFPERNEQAEFTLNVEAMAMDVSVLTSLEGKYANIHYQSKLENALYDLRFQAASLFGAYAPETTDPAWKTISGTLQGAGTETQGDLPNEFSVVNEQGEAVVFEEFITSEIAAANGQPVTAFYAIRSRETITHLSPLEN
jgi:hypothetical protein